MTLATSSDAKALGKMFAENPEVAKITFGLTGLFTLWFLYMLFFVDWV